MSTRLWQATRVALALLAGPAILAGCAAPDAKGLIQMPGSRIVLRQLPDTAGFEVTVGEATKLSLPGHLNARIEAMWVSGATQLVLIDGATKAEARIGGPACPSRPHLLLAKENQASIRPLGKCDDRFSYAWQGEQLTIRQLNARDPMIWTFRDGSLSGPVTQSSLTRRGRPGSAPPAQDRPPEGGGGEGGGAGRDGATPDVIPREQGMRDPVAPPPVSRPVGEDVIPPPVGGGPLPPPAPRPPRLF